MGLKGAGRDLEARITQPLDEKLVKPFGFRSGRGIRKRRPVAFAAVSVESKLGNHEKLAAGVGNRPIHFALIILKNPQVFNLIGKSLRIFFTILFGDTQQDAETRSDLANDLTARGYTSFRDSLNDSAHVKSVGQHDVWKGNRRKGSRSIEGHSRLLTEW
jgi:hypothetical protein